MLHHVIYARLMAFHVSGLTLLVIIHCCLIVGVFGFLLIFDFPFPIPIPHNSLQEGLSEMQFIPCLSSART